MWLIISKRKRKITGADLDMAFQTGVIWDKKPTNAQLENALFDPENESLVKIKIEVSEK
ncbi:MAG: hypothetical protein KGL39_55430 [Patescibacteria group bacterium]|nr:hypothetical protein [Patescibacteria group bacterium]MDE2106524.1 hypothetical protein [Patescibacteria group bacterium]